MGYEEIFPLFPPLTWEMERCPSPQVFFDESYQWIPDDQVQWLELIMTGDLDAVNVHDCPLLMDVASFFDRLKRETHLLREGKGGTSILSAGFLKENNPLEREEKLLRLQWEFLEHQKTPEAAWGLRAVFIYMLQLRILIRRSSFIHEDGAQHFEKLCHIDTTTEAA